MQEIKRSVGQDLEEGQNSSKQKPVDKPESGKTDQDNHLPPKVETLKDVNQSSCGSAKECSADEKTAIHQQSEENVENMSQAPDCDYLETCSSKSSISSQMRQYSPDRSFGQQMAHLVWVGLRLSQILLSILLPTTLIFLRWM